MKSELSLSTRTGMTRMPAPRAAPSRHLGGLPTPCLRASVVSPLFAAFLFLFSAVVQAKVDLVTLPSRDKVQLTIYNSADLTLVREQRELTLKKGLNRLQFSWENTLIDPTSLSLTPKAQADKLEVFDLNYPPRVKNLGVWTIKSEVSGKVPFEITYLTSGINWRAFYMGTLSADEKTMKIEGYVRVANGSGEDYENAQTRLIVGKVHLLDEIAALARRQYPYGDPRGGPDEARKKEGSRTMTFKLAAKQPMGLVGSTSIKEIIKEGLSEYFLYTIEGTETIPTGWGKRLPSFTAPEVPVVNLYKFEEERYGLACVRFLSFKNDTEHKLGETPIPDGMLRVYRGVDAAQHLSYEGASSFKYIPVNQEVELNLGAVANVIVEPTLMKLRTEQFTFDGDGNVDGWDEVREFKVVAKNTRDVAVKLALTRNFPTQYWTLDRQGDFGEYAKVDLDTVKFTLALAPRSQKEFAYTLTTRHGRRQEIK